VESAAIASYIPTWNVKRVPYELAGAPPADERQRPNASMVVISPGYFRTLGATVLSGRDFNDGDRVSGVPVAIVNQRFASRHWPGENPLGRRVRLFAGNKAQPWLTVVGVASNIAQNDVARPESNFLLYLPYRQVPYEGGINLLVRARVVPESLGTALRHEVDAVDSSLPIFGPFTLAKRFQGLYWLKGLYGVLFLIFAAIALLLASFGLYAVIAHSISQRTQEIGVRMAIGATARDILKLVLTQGMLPLGIGLTIGLVASFGVNRVLKSELVRVSPADPITLVVTSALLVLFATLGCVIPARRAMRVDPAVALRHD
jgi:putative ABC transport system permease protein